MSPAPSGNLSKKGFAKMCEFISAERPDDAAEIIDLVSRSMTHAFNFSPSAVCPLEVSRKNYEAKKNLLKNLGLTEYERYAKPRREKKRAKYPDLPATVVYSTPESVLNTYTEQSVNIMK